jgi:hypothetical protein
VLNPVMAPQEQVSILAGYFSLSYPKLKESHFNGFYYGQKPLA